MRIVISSSGTELDAPASPVFGRCQAYVFVDTECMTVDAVANPAIGAPSGAGIQAAQLVVEHGAEAVVTGSVGPNAFNVLESAGVPIYLFGGGTVREAAIAFKSGQLQSIADASSQAGRGMGPGMGGGRGMGRGMGGGRGMGRGMGRRMQPGTGGFDAPASPPASQPGASPREEAGRRDEAQALKEMAKKLQEQLGQVMDRLDQLEGDA
ncbi:MAG: NifB/NifX family molybdenum-iron cluster-binding protein [Chloroflexota bacterium]